MPVPVVVAQGTEHASSTNGTPGLPAGLQAYDVLILTAESGNEDIATPAGYAAIGTGQIGVIGVGETARMEVWWKRVLDPATEAAPTLTDPGNHITSRLHAVRGCIASGDPYEAALTGNSHTTAISVPGDTTTVGDCLIAICAVHGNDSTAANFSNWANADLANVTERGDSGSTSGNGGGVACATGEKAAAGAYGATTADLVVPHNWAGIALALEGAAGMPTFQAVGTIQSGAGAITVAWPTHQTNDIALLICEADDAAITLTTANGFVQVPDSPLTSGANTGLRSRIAVFWCRATSGAMASPVVADAGDHVVGRIFTFRGVKTTGDPWNVTSGAAGANPVKTAVTVEGITTLGPDRLVMACVAASVDTLVDQFSGWANGDLTNVAEKHDHFTDLGHGGGQGMMTGEKAAAGAIGDSTATLATVGGQAWVIFALIPADPTGIGTPLSRRTGALKANLARGR